MCQLLLIPVLCVGAFIFSFVSVVEETITAGINLQNPSYDTVQIIAFFVSLGLAVWWVFLIVRIVRKKRHARKTNSLEQRN